MPLRFITTSATAPPPVAEEPKTPPPKKEVVASGGPDGYLRLGSKPWTKVSIDGRDTGQTTPIGKLPLSAGTHKVTLINPQFQIRETFTVEIHAGETETVIKDLRPKDNGGDGD